MAANVQSKYVGQLLNVIEDQHRAHAALYGPHKLTRKQLKWTCTVHAPVVLFTYLWSQRTILVINGSNGAEISRLALD